MSDCSNKVGRDVEPDKINRVCKCRSNGIMISQVTKTLIADVL